MYIKNVKQSILMTKNSTFSIVYCLKNTLVLRKYFKLILMVLD